MKLSEAFEVLGLSDSANIKEVKAAYRVKALETHPDKGGNQFDFVRVQAAYEIICRFFKEDSAGEEIGIPEELRTLIDDLVRSFRMQFETSESRCEAEFHMFNKRMMNYIFKGSRKELKNFGEYFRSDWNNLIINLFGAFNEECRAMIRKYEQWFDETMEQTFEEIYKKELKSYKRSPRFYGYMVALALGGLLLATVIDFEPSVAGFMSRVTTGMAPVGFLPIIYWIDCRLRKKTPADVQTMSVQLFKIDPNAEFQGSSALKQGSQTTAAAAVAGMAIGDLLSEGAGIPFVGAAAGMIIGGIIDRIQNPTEKIRKSILTEFEEFMAVAQPQVTAYVVEANRELMLGIKERIEKNYEQKMKQTILLLAERN